MVPGGHRIIEWVNRGSLHGHRGYGWLQVDIGGYKELDGHWG